MARSWPQAASMKGNTGPFNPDGDARRAVAAKWIRRIEATAHCTGTENE